MSKPRLESIDMARGVSILLVAAFHANTTSSINGLLSDLRMPLFFLISGFLFSKRYFDNPKTLIRSRIKTLVIPYFSAAIIFYMFWVLRTILDKDETSLSRALLGVFYGISPDDWLIVNVQLWFLACIFCTQVIFCVVMRFVHKSNFHSQIIIFLTISLIGFLIGKIIYLPWSFDTALVCQVFVFTGYKLKEYGVLDKFKPVSFVTLLLAVIFAIAAYYNPPIAVGSRIYNNLLLFYIAGICGSLVVLKIVSLLSSIKWVSKTLSYIGRESLTILIFHGGLFIYATGVISNRIGVNIHWIIAWIISIAGSLVIAEIIKRVPTLNMLLNGKSMDKPVSSNKKESRVA